MRRRTTARRRNVRAGWRSATGCEYVDMAQFYVDQEMFRSIPVDLMLRYGFVPYRRDGDNLVDRGLRSDGPAGDRRVVAAARDAADCHGRHAIRDRIDPEEERGIAARARRGDRAVRAAVAARGRGRRRKPHRRAADERHQPRHPAGGLDDLHRHPAPRQRHPRGDAGRRGAREVPHRRRAAARHAARSTSSSTAPSCRASR